MKNPFVKQKHNGVLIGSIAVGTAVAGGVAWLLFTERGQATLASIKELSKEKGKDLLASFVTAKTGISKSLTKPAADVAVD